MFFVVVVAVFYCFLGLIVSILKVNSVPAD